MDTKAAGELGRKLLPIPLFRLARRLASAACAPVKFSWAKGHARSAWRGRAVDVRGEPVPWYTYPAIDFLKTKSFAGRRVLEFGAGQSTLWWVAQGAVVTSLEVKKEWWAYVTSRVADQATVLLASSPTDIPASVFEHTYDVIVIDGLRREVAAKASIDLVAPAGAVVFDNSEGFWNDESTKGRYPIVELMHAAGFSRVDFYGFTPGNVAESCTSIFFRGNTFLFDSAEPPRMLQY
jgi:hypothetical protein